MTKKINKAQTIRELLVKDKNTTWADVKIKFEQLGTTVTQAQFYQVRTAEQGGGTKKKKTTKSKAVLNSLNSAVPKKTVVAAKTKAPVDSTTGTNAITFRDNLYQFMAEARGRLGRDTVDAAAKSVFDQLG